MARYEDDWFIRLTSVFALVVTVIATMSNMVTISVCLTRKLRSIPTFVFIAFISVMETMPLYFRILDAALHVLFEYTFVNSNEIACKIATFTHYALVQSSVWLLVALQIERYLAVKFEAWSESKFNSKRASIVSIGIIMIFFCLNFHVLYSANIKTIDIHNMSYGYCYEHYLQLPPYIYFCINTLVPILVSLPAIVLLWKAHKIAEDKAKTMITSVLILTTAFFLVTTPSSILVHFFLKELQKTLLGNQIVFFVYVFRYTYSIFSLIILFTFNEKFSQNCKRLLSKVKIGKEYHSVVVVE